MKIIEVLLYSTLLLSLTADSYQHEKLTDNNDSAAAAVVSDALGTFLAPGQAVATWVFPEVEEAAPETNLEAGQAPEDTTEEGWQEESEESQGESQDETQDESQDTWVPEEGESSEPESEETWQEETPEEEVVSDKLIYYYGDPIPAGEEVDGAAYFADTAVVGDSRSQGLMAFGNLGGGANMTGVALSVYNIWDREYVSTNAGTLTLLNALNYGTYQKVYISLGVNSLGYPSLDRWYDNYSRLVDEIRAKQPQAEIYIQSLLPVNEPILQTRGTSAYFNNTKVREFNAVLQGLCVDKQLYYIDLYANFLDGTGQLPYEASNDGIHFSSKYCQLWAQLLRTHTIDKNVYEVRDRNA